MIIVCLVAGSAGMAHGQNGIRGRVLLPRTHGATVLSTYIDAQARRMVAVGEFMKSAAVARKINLEADRVAMENSVIWVETYFERRKLNRQYRDEASLNYLELQTIRARNLHRRIVNAEKTGNAIDEMNYMMSRLLADAETHQAIFMDQIPPDKIADLSLTPNQLSHILLKEQGGSTSARPFRPVDPKVFGDDWPAVFMRPEFALERDRFEQAREHVIAEIKAGQLTPQTLEAMQLALKQVEQKFDRVYVWIAMKDKIDYDTFAAYKDSGKKFFRAQAASALRAFVIKEIAAYTNDLEFHGDDLVDLIRHCAQHNLIFADPEVGDKSTYSRIYQEMRRLYLEFNPEQPDFNL